MAKKEKVTEIPATPRPVPVPSDLTQRAKTAPHDHWTISNRVPVRVGEEIALARHRVKILEILRHEDCYDECVVEVLGAVDGMGIPPLKYA